MMLTFQKNADVGGEVGLKIRIHADKEGGVGVKHLRTSFIINIDCPLLATT